MSLKPVMPLPVQFLAAWIGVWLGRYQQQQIEYSVRKSFRENILGCPCGGRRKVIAFIDEKPVIERILGHLGLPTTGPPTAPARLPALAEDSLWQDDVHELQQSLP